METKFWPETTSQLLRSDLLVLLAFLFWAVLWMERRNPEIAPLFGILFKEANQKPRFLESKQSRGHERVVKGVS